MFSNYLEFIQRINSLAEEQIQDITMDRLRYLEQTFPSEEEDKSLGLERVYKGYINSDTPIKTSNMVDPFHVDHADLYMEFLRFLKSKGQLQDGYAIIYHIQDFMGKIFGVFGSENNRQGVYLKHYNDYDSGKTEASNLSISKFYNNNSALCIERSAVVQNLLSFMGIDSYMVCGKLQTDKGTETHAFNIFQPKEGEYVLYDSTNPVPILDKDGTNYITPAFMSLGAKPEDRIDFKYDQLESYLGEGFRLESKLLRQYAIPYDLDMAFNEYRARQM